MLFRETVTAGASGSMGGVTASHNRFGRYLRQRIIPTNPNTDAQAAVRANFQQLAALWQTTLTDAQREAWSLYGSNVPVINRIGDPINLTGLNHYIRSNSPRLQAGLPRVDDAPTEFNLGDYTAITFGALETGNFLLVNFTDTDDWVSEDDAAMLVYGSRVQAVTINFFRGPYRFADSIDGDSTTPPTSPASVSSAFALTMGLKVFGRVQVTRADGRLSAAQFVEAIVG